MTRSNLDEIKNFLSNRDIRIHLKYFLDDIQYFNYLINTKANKDNIINALNKKENKN